MLHLVSHYLKLPFIFSLAFLLCTAWGTAQSNQVNEWEEELSKAEGQDRIVLLEQFSKDLANENIPMADSLAKEGITLAKSLGDSLSAYRIQNNLGRLYSSMNKVDKGFELIEECLDYFEGTESLVSDKAKIQLSLAALQIKKREYTQADSLISESESFFEDSNDALWQSKVLHTRGLLYVGKREYKKALDYFSKALEISKDLEDTDFVSGLMANISLIKKKQGLYPEALELQFEVLSMEPSSLSKSKCYSLIGEIYLELEDWKPAIKYTEMAIDFAKKVGYESGINYSLYNLGIVHIKEKNYGEALKCYEESLAIQKKYNLDISSTLGAIGTIYNLLGQPEKANKYYDEQLELAKAQNNWEGIWAVNFNRGFALYSAGQHEEALKYALICLQIAEEKEHLQFLVQSNEMLSEVYKVLGNNEKVQHHQDQYVFFKDSISSLRRLKKIGVLEQEHLSRLQKDSLDVANKKDVSTNQGNGFFSGWKGIGGISLLVLALVFSFFFFKKYRKKETVPSENQNSDQTKMDQYFEELFARLDQNETASEVKKNRLSNAEVNPINDMAEFLKTNIKEPNDWASFEKYFEKVHKDFFKNLKSKYPTITINELNMCALLKLNLRNKDIAQIMGISPDSVRKAQHRLSKKLALSADEVLRDFVLMF